MVEITGTHLGSDVEDEHIVDTWRLPALGERQVRYEARANARFKGREGVEVGDVSEIEQGDLPGQKIYEVQTRSRR